MASTVSDDVAIWFRECDDDDEDEDDDDDGNENNNKPYLWMLSKDVGCVKWHVNFAANTRDWLCVHLCEHIHNVIASTATDIQTRIVTTK